VSELIQMLVLVAFIGAASWLLNAVGEMVVQQRRGERPRRRRASF
jgi:hypothetical protein